MCVNIYIYSKYNFCRAAPKYILNSPENFQFCFGYSYLEKIYSPLAQGGLEIINVMLKPFFKVEVQFYN